MEFQSPPPTVNQNFQPPSTSSSDTNLPIQVITILGIVATSILLLGYYVFVIKCFLTWRYGDIANWCSWFQWWRRGSTFTVHSIVIKDHGLNASVIQAIPTFQYKNCESVEKRLFHECTVCLSEFQAEERIRVLPNCLHVFHLDCIDKWLKTNANCPICRHVITTESLISNEQLKGSVQDQNPEIGSYDIVIEVGLEGNGSQRELHTSGITNNAAGSCSRESEVGSTHLKQKSCSLKTMGDQCIVITGKDEQLCTQPIRSSSMEEYSSHGQIYMAEKVNMHSPNSGRVH